MVSRETVDGKLGESRTWQRRSPRIQVDDQCGASRRRKPERGDAVKDRIWAEESPNEHGGRSYGPSCGLGTP